MPATSQAQKHFMAMVAAVKAGHGLTRPKGTSRVRWRQLMRDVHKAARSTSMEKIRHYSRTPSKGLPRRAGRKG